MSGAHKSHCVYVGRIFMLAVFCAYTILREIVGLAACSFVAA